MSRYGFERSDMIEVVILQCRSPGWPGQAEALKFVFINGIKPHLVATVVYRALQAVWHKCIGVLHPQNAKCGNLLLYPTVYIMFALQALMHRAAETLRIAPWGLRLDPELEVAAHASEYNVFYSNQKS